MLPLRRLCEALTPAVLKLNQEFDCSGRTGANFSRINRDIRFAKDKTPYKSQMYLKFGVPFPGDAESGQFYAGFTAETVTAGFRLYAGGKRKESAIAVMAQPRMEQNPRWLAQQKRRLGRRYESYWWMASGGQLEKGECVDCAAEVGEGGGDARGICEGAGEDVSGVVSALTFYFTA